MHPPGIADRSVDIIAGPCPSKERDVRKAVPAMAPPTEPLPVDKRLNCDRWLRAHCPTR